jgi:hypothetical protein
MGIMKRDSRDQTRLGRLEEVRRGCERFREDGWGQGGLKVCLSFKI